MLCCAIGHFIWVSLVFRQRRSQYIIFHVRDQDDDKITCYKYRDACTPGFCDDQSGDQFYVIYEECVLLLPTGSMRSFVGISVEDKVDVNDAPIGGQTLLELPLTILNGPSSCVGHGSFSNTNPSQCHWLVSLMTIKIIIYATTKEDGASIGASGLKCAIQSNPDELLGVTVSEVTDFDSTVIDAIDPTATGVWQKFEIAIELKSAATFTDDFPLCCFLVFGPDGSRKISEATCDITFSSFAGVSSLFTITSWSGTNPGAVTKFVIDNFNIALELSAAADSMQSNSAAAITFSDGSSLRWALSVDDINNSAGTLSGSGTSVTISLAQSKKDEIPLNENLDVFIENGFFQRTDVSCKQYSEEFLGGLTFCFHLGEISPEDDSLELEYTPGNLGKLLFSFADSLGTVRIESITENIKVTDDAQVDYSDIDNTVLSGVGTNGFEILLPFEFAITQIKTVIEVELPANLFCITQCSDEAVCNLAYPPMGQNFSVCHNLPVTVNSVNPNETTLLTSFQNFLTIDFNYEIEKGTNGQTATITGGSTDVTIAAETANFTNGKFYFEFNTALPDVQYSVDFDAGFASTTTDTCDGVTLLNEADSDSLSFCFYEQPSINTNNITPVPSSNILVSSVQLSIGISGVQFGPALEPGSSPVIVYKGDDITNPFQILDFSGTPPSLTASSLNEVIGTINLVANDYYTVVIPPSFVQVTDCSTPYPNTDTFTFNFCSIDLVLTSFDFDFGVQINQDEDVLFELYFVNDIKIGLDDPYIVISSNIVKIFDDTEGNRYKIENNKATIILPLASKDVRTHEVVFPEGLFIYKRDDLCGVIPTKKIRRSFSEIASQVPLPNNAENTDTTNTATSPIQSEGSVAEIIQRINEVSNPIVSINSETESFNPSRFQDNVLQQISSEDQRTIGVQPQRDQERLGVQGQFGEEILRLQRSRQQTIKRKFVKKVQDGVIQPNDESRRNQRRFQDRFGRFPLNSRFNFDGFGEDVKQINKIFGREE